MGTRYGQFCPVALAAEVLAERWTPLVVRELLCGSTRFNELQRGLSRISAATLDARLKKLQLAGIVQRDPAGGAYTLTEPGRALFPIIEGMGLWAQHWLRHDMVEDRNLDPDLLMWDIRRTVTTAPIDQQRKVIEFRLAGVTARKQRYWLVRDPGETDLCYRDPGFALDLAVATPLRVLTAIWLGHLSLKAALTDGSLRLEGAQAEQRAFRDWFSLSPFAPAAQAAGSQAIT